MPKYTLTISSKNKKSLTNFVKFLKQSLPTLEIFNISKIEKRKKKKTVISVLKSPHVNKTAQEKYEYQTYSYVIQTYSLKTKKYVLLLKYIKNNLFPEIKIRITIFIKKKTKFVTLKNYNLNWNYKKNIQIKNSQHLKKLKKFNCFKSITKISNYLKVIDCLGEFEINKKP